MVNTSSVTLSNSKDDLNNPMLEPPQQPGMISKLAHNVDLVFPTLPPEVEEGNIEYKLKLVDPSSNRLDHLVTQMKWRLKEGDGEAFYEIGVEDTGTISGLLKEELDSSLATLTKMAKRLEAETIIVRERTINYPNCSPKYAAEVLVRQVYRDQEFTDIRVACLGNVDVGKSTLLGVLSYGDLDNGRGRARLNMFRHLHEIQTGRTSSISHEILGFDSSGNVLDYSGSTAEEICASASKLITFLDLAGHQKYIKTTILGLTGCAPQVVMLVVAANRGITGTTKEHLGLAVHLQIPFLIVINKIDLCSADAVQRTVVQLEKILKSKGCRKEPYVMNDEEDVASAADNLSFKKITPIFKVSSVTGENLSLLRSFYQLLPTLRSKEHQMLLKQSPEFQIDEIFSVQKVGTVLAGTVRQGVIREGETLLLGPSAGKFTRVIVNSIHRNRTPCRIVQANQSVCVAVKFTNGQPSLRRGQVLLAYEEKPVCCTIFEAEVFVLFHPTRISKKFQTTVHIGSVVQTATIIHMTKDFLTTGQRDKVRFRFIGQPEYIRKGDRLLFREGRSKGIGEITQISLSSTES